MKRLTTYAFIAMMVVANLSSMAEDAIQRFYSKMDSITRSQDGEKAAQLLLELSNSDMWSFGAGLGPTDSTSLQIELLQGCSRFICNDAGEQWLKKYAAENKDNATAQQWATFLCSPSENTQLIVQMLANQNPAIRWLGLQKSEKSGKPPAIMNALRQIAEQDSYVVFVRKQKEWKGNTPPPSDWTYNDAVAPLRLKAAEILEKNGVKDLRTDKGIEDLAVARLVGILTKHPDRDFDVTQAVQFLGHETRTRLAIREWNAKSASDEKAVNELKKAEQTSR